MSRAAAVAMAQATGVTSNFSWRSTSKFAMFVSATLNDQAKALAIKVSTSLNFQDLISLKIANLSKSEFTGFKNLLN